MVIKQGRKLPISICLITFNEERNLPACLDSVKWADEVVIVDSFSKDNTIEIAHQYQAKVIQQPLASFAEQKNTAIRNASNDWVLCLDADERVSPELAQEIEAEFNMPTIDWDGYYINRHSFYLGRWINHGGWYPSYKLILFRKDKGAWGGMDLHTKVFLEGRTKRLKGDLWHFTYQDLSHQLKTVDNFSRIVAQQWHKEGKRLRAWSFLTQPLGKFIETYLYKKGYKDGMPGFIIALVSSFYVFLKYAKYWELLNVNENSPGNR
jgi:glycosyltransferase involved in cell wall biosynthesis